MWVASRGDQAAGVHDGGFLASHLNDIAYFVVHCSHGSWNVGSTRWQRGPTIMCAGMWPRYTANFVTPCYSDQPCDILIRNIMSTEYCKMYHTLRKHYSLSI